MKTIKLALTLVITTLLAACDATSSDSLTLDSGKVIESAVTLDEQNSAESVSLSKTEPHIQQEFNTTDWAPHITKTPAKQAHEPFFLPDENVKKIRNFFNKNQNKKQIKNKQFEETAYGFFSVIQYYDDTILDYSLDKVNNKYFVKMSNLRGHYQPHEPFNNIHKDAVYKMLDISGADDPEIFFQELISSPKITKYKGCTVQQKQSKYAMVDLTSCEFDNRTDLSLYKSKS
ncbi:hypothetical protein [Psychrobacter sp. DAB_AL43B]|uniref:hypothetical protein n=1 Tax=Psychrobacter sp. DAB_AL43B TaxID=1028416 RepID=UPI0009A6E251|nr:hypothetical protein [Psychrobacter sp. DAB_AL43B]SLJ84067.1 hypothetical protein DABAL43B_0868 [Psychrobacter sp. DAB_AL43B]